CRASINDRHTGLAGPPARPRPADTSQPSLARSDRPRQSVLRYAAGQHTPPWSRATREPRRSQGRRRVTGATTGGPWRPSAWTTPRSSILTLRGILARRDVFGRKAGDRRCRWARRAGRSPCRRHTVRLHVAWDLDAA